MPSFPSEAPGCLSVSLHPVGQLYVNVHERPGIAAVTGIARQTQNKDPLLSG